MMYFTVARIAELLQKHDLGILQEWRILESRAAESVYLINQVVVLHLAAGADAQGRLAKVAAMLRFLACIDEIPCERLVAYEPYGDDSVAGSYLFALREPGLPAIDCWHQIDSLNQRRLSLRMGVALARLHHLSWADYGGYNPATGGLGRFDDWREYLLDRAAEALTQLWGCQGLPVVLLNAIEQFLAVADLPRRPRPAFVHGDYGLHNAIVIQENGHWRLHCLTGWHAALSGDTEYEFATGLLVEPDEVNPLAEPFLSGYRELRPLEQGWEQRSAVYRLIYHLALCAFIWREHAGNPVMLHYHRSRLIDALKMASASR
jgi:aminoglycoside phosphotransferase (APT) family kinase protein